MPFGIGKMFTLIPIGFGISGTVGVVALNLVLGGLIGGVILIWKMCIRDRTTIVIPMGRTGKYGSIGFLKFPTAVCAEVNSV